MKTLDQQAQEIADTTEMRFVFREMDFWTEKARESDKKGHSVAYARHAKKREIFTKAFNILFEKDQAGALELLGNMEGVEVIEGEPC